MILDQICDHKKREVEDAKKARPLSLVQESVEQAGKPRDFWLALRTPGMSLVAEVKRASPVKGEFLREMDIKTLAGIYEEAGARAISVLTDEKYFGGSLNDLKSVRGEVSLPCLRKEFIVDEYQIYEARAAQADAILLIVRILSDGQLREYLALAGDLGMAALVETHNAPEVERALAAGAHIIGINNRNLESFEVDLDTTLNLKRLVPGGKVLVSESGITTREHVQRLDDGGVDAILVGEALVTSEDIYGKIRELLDTDVRQEI